MNNDLTIFRALYRNIQGEAIEAGLAANAADFNAFALRGVADEVKAAARGGDVEAAMALCDAAEAWLDGEMAAAREAAGEDDWEAACEAAGEDDWGDWDERAAYRAAVWKRACDAQLSYVD